VHRCLTTVHNSTAPQQGSSAEGITCSGLEAGAHFDLS